MVRQQEEAEREAIALQRGKRQAAIPLASRPGAGSTENISTSAVGMKPVGYATAAGRFVSYGLAGAILGFALGSAAASFWALPKANAELSMFGAAAIMALLCGIYSQI